MVVWVWEVECRCKARCKCKVVVRCRCKAVECRNKVVNYPCNMLQEKLDLINHSTTTHFSTIKVHQDLAVSKVVCKVDQVAKV